MDFLTAIFDFLWPIIGMFLLFGGTVLVHEWGHFITARMFGLRIDTFSIGMGPAIWSKVRNGVKYQIAWLPIGGYVALPQMDITGSAFENDDAKAGKLKPVDPWKRIVISLAGPFMNVVTAFVICLLVWAIGKPYDPNPEAAVIDHVSVGSAAHEAGLRSGDLVLKANEDQVSFWQDLLITSMLNDHVDLTVERDGKVQTFYDVPTEANSIGFRELKGVYPYPGDIIDIYVGKLFVDGPAYKAGIQLGDLLKSVDGQRITSSDMFYEVVQQSKGAPLELVIEREGTAMTFELQGMAQKNGSYLIGIVMGAITEPIHPNPFKQMQYFTGSITRTLKAFLREEERNDAAKGIGGSVIILAGMHSQLKGSIMQGLWFTALINVNLAIINLLPLIILDGGHIMISLYEIIFRRTPNKKLITAAANVMVVFLISLMVFLTFRDVSTLRRVNRTIDEENNQQEQPVFSTPSPETPEAEPTP